MENQEIKPKTQNSTVSLSASIVVAAVLIAGAILFSGRGASVGLKPATTTTSAVPPVSESDFVRGDSLAEVTIIEYADFSCGFCGVHHPTLKKIIENYKGKVKWVYRHLPIFNKSAAIASTCVGNILGNEKFWEYSDILMENQKIINQDYLKETAVSLGATDGAYESCINDSSIASKINSEFNKIRILAGFNATPYNVLVDRNGNMYPFSGALSYEDMASLVESVL